MSIVIGWPSIAASASMPPTPQPRYAETVDHGRVRVRADHRVRVGQRAVLLDVENDAAQVLEVDLVDDAGIRRHDAEVIKR